MKKSITQIAAVMVFLATMAGCKSEQEKAQQTAEKFLEAFYVDMDFEECEELSTPTSTEVLTGRKTITQSNPYSKEEAPDIAVTNTIVVNESNARVIYAVNGAQRDLFLVKNSKNKWLVDAQESELSEDAGPGAGKGSGFAVATSVSTKEKNADKK